MGNPSQRQEVDRRTIKLIVGLIAISLAPLTYIFAGSGLESISASYWMGASAQGNFDWMGATARAIFIGFLFAIGAFMLCYNGRSWPQMVLSKVAALAALGVALFPCGCDRGTSFEAKIHYGSAAVMFLILAFFSYCFYKRAIDKKQPEANFRAAIYAACGLAILVSIVALTIDTFWKDSISGLVQNFTFYGEATGLIAFGVSWLVSSHVLPVVTSPDDRFSPLSNENPD